MTSNGIERKETGTLVNGGQPGAYIEVKGIVAYTDTHGEEIVVQYTADNQGYHAQPSTNQQMYHKIPPNIFIPSSAFGVSILRIKNCIYKHI